MVHCCRGCTSAQVDDKSPRPLNMGRETSAMAFARLTKSIGRAGECVAVKALGDGRSMQDRVERECSVLEGVGEGACRLHSGCCIQVSPLSSLQTFECTAATLPSLAPPTSALQPFFHTLHHCRHSVFLYPPVASGVFTGILLVLVLLSIFFSLLARLTLSAHKAHLIAQPSKLQLTRSVTPPPLCPRACSLVTHRPSPPRCLSPEPRTDASDISAHKPRNFSHRATQALFSSLLPACFFFLLHTHHDAKNSIRRGTRLYLGL